MLDVVGSTHIAADLGDTRYRELSSRFVRIVRTALRRFGGREEDHAGDSFFATFDQPHRAIRCAVGICDDVRWVLSRTLGTLTRIDPSTYERTGDAQVGPDPAGLAAGAGAIWVGDEDGVIRRVDEDTRQVTTIAFGAEIRCLAYDDEPGRLWVDVAALS
jgi:streptogramin lyase